jgi:RNA polymerase sigma-70 factor (ECF subfamily)
VIPAPPRDSTIGLPLLATARSGHSLVPTHIEEEVIGLFDQFRNRLLRYLFSVGISAQDGEEIVQEVFLSLFQHLQRGKSRGNLRGWIFRVAHNLALKQRQASRRSAQNGESTEALFDRQFDAAPNPEEQVVSAQRRQRLRAVVRALPEQDRYCIHLRAEGLRYREIAEVLGMSLGAVATSLGRSLARLGRADGR